MKKILIISDGNPGHYNQSRAVADAIKEIFPAEDRIIEVKLRKVLKPIIRFLLNSKLNFIFKNNPIGAVKLFYKDFDFDFKPDIIISSGKNTSFLNGLFGLSNDNKNFFIGNPKKLDNNLFTAVFTVLELGFDNEIIIETAPTKISVPNIESFIEEYGLNPEYNFFALLIGGDGAGYRYTEEDIGNLIKLVNENSNAKWLVTTSRRTDEKFEELMEKEMNAEIFTPYNKEPKKVVSSFMALSDAVFVTEDSTSMIGEGIASQKPVFSLIPKVYQNEDNYEKIINKFVFKKRLKRLNLDEDRDIDLNNFAPLKQTSKDEIIEKIKRYL